LFAVSATFARDITCSSFHEHAIDATISVTSRVTLFEIINNTVATRSRSKKLDLMSLLMGFFESVWTWQGQQVTFCDESF
jgi:hypothetical protein